MPVKLSILGTSAALPAKNRNLSAHLLEIDGHSLLFDCGEGTQFQLKKYKKKIHNISCIFISHFHGDHLFGLPGLISSMHLLDRVKPLTIYGPEGLEQIIKSIYSLSKTKIKYPIEFVVVSGNTKVKILENKYFSVYSFPLKHSIETYGYMFEKAKDLLNIKKQFVKSNKIPVEWFVKIKQGEDYIDDLGNVFKNKDITEPEKDIISYAYCSDTVYFEDLANWVKNVGLLYHESTFLNENKEDAKDKKHSTAQQAAMIANKAGVKKLLLGHFSSRYTDVSDFEKEAKPYFDNVILGKEGLEINL